MPHATPSPSLIFVTTEELERKLDQATKKQRTQQQALQTVQDQNNEKLALLRDEIRLTHESVERSKKILIHTFIKCLNEHTIWKMRSDAINSKVHTATSFNLRNFICHKSEHCTHTLKHFVPHFTLIETISFQ